MCLFLTGLKTIGRLIYRQNWCDSGCGWNWNAHKKKNKFRIFSRFFTHSPRHHHQANATYLFSEKRWTNRPSSKEYTHLHLLNSNFSAFLTHNAVSSLSTTIGLQCCKVALGKMNSFSSFSRSLSARLLFFLYVFRTLALCTLVHRTAANSSLVCTKKSTFYVSIILCILSNKWYNSTYYFLLPIWYSTFFSTVFGGQGKCQLGSFGLHLKTSTAKVTRFQSEVDDYF